jgi:hypothetical protein
LRSERKSSGISGVFVSSKKSSHECGSPRQYNVSALRITLDKNFRTREAVLSRQTNSLASPIAKKLGDMAHCATSLIYTMIDRSEWHYQAGASGRQNASASGLDPRQSR